VQYPEFAQRTHPSQLLQSSSFLHSGPLTPGLHDPCAGVGGPGLGGAGLGGAGDGPGDAPPHFFVDLPTAVT